MKQVEKMIEGSKVEFFKITQRKRGKLLRKMIANLSSLNNQNAKVETAIAGLFDMPVFDEITDMIYPEIRVDGKDFSQDAVYEEIMTQKEAEHPMFEIILFNSIIEVYLGESLNGQAIEGNGSPTPTILARKIGSPGGSGVQ